MSLSIRNQIAGTALSVTAGEAMATVTVRLEGGQEITAAITTESVRELGIESGSSVRALVKATEVSLATTTASGLGGLSIRNQLPGTVTGVTTGGAMAAVTVTVAGGELTAAITKDAVDDLELAPGSPVVALIKSTEIALASA